MPPPTPHRHATLPSAVFAALRVALVLGWVLVLPQTGRSQFGNSIDSPQTDLTPIGPPSLGGAGGYGGSVGGYNPPVASAPPAGFDPYATSTLGGAVLGTPAPIGSTGIGAPSTFNAPAYGGSGYPNGGLLGRLFGGGASPGIGAGSLSSGPTMLAPPANALPAPAYGNTTFGQPNVYGQPNIYGQPGSYGPATGFGSQPAFGGGGAYPSAIYPANSPNTLFPGGLFGGAGIGGVFAQDPNAYNSYRLFQGTRLRHGYISGADGADEVAKHQTDVSVALAFQNFLYSGRPLYVAPSFSLHLWNGPEDDGAFGSADLPGNVYDAFLDFGWQTDPNQMFGAELGLRVGVFSDFEVMNGDSLRVRGKGLGSFRLTPASTLKVGVYYLDRDSIKLLPAGGLLWQPTPNTRFDIFFPEPKLAQYWRTIGTQDVWWYLGGEYGGGAWTIERTGGQEDSVEMNELIAVAGFEWGRSQLIRTGRRRAFVEFGWVFDREVHYENNPQDDFTPEGAFIVRGGFGY